MVSHHHPCALRTFNPLPILKMTANERKGFLLVKGYSLKALADELDVSAALISQVVNERQRSLRVERRIAEILGRDLVDVFPQRAGAAEKLVGAGAL